MTKPIASEGHDIYKLVHGTHFTKPDAEGMRKECKPGDLVELTPEQAKAFGSKFKHYDEVVAESQVALRAKAILDAQAQAKADFEAKEQAKLEVKAVTKPAVTGPAKVITPAAKGANTQPAPKAIANANAAAVAQTAAKVAQA